MPELELERRRIPFKGGSFAISRGTRTHTELIEVRLTADGKTGRGEAIPYPRYGHTLESLTAELEGLAPALAEGLDRAALQAALPAGPARNGLDCAFWDLEAKLSGRPAWQLAGLAEPRPVITAYTLGLDTPEAMRAKAEANADRPLLKLKLGGEGDLERLAAVREGAPDARLIVDANEGWTPEIYLRLVPRLVELGVEMVEQPLPAAEDAPLSGLERPLPVCADEACHDRATLPGLAGKYDRVNIKLDKTGGLTEALALKAAAEADGYGIMVGCMMGTAISMAPGILVAQGVAVVDLDAPLLLDDERGTGLVYDAAGVHPAPPELWG